MGNSFFKNINDIVCIFFLMLFILISCEPTQNKAQEEPKFENTDSLSLEVIPEKIEAPQQTVEWSDGNIYSYDYIDEISEIDSLGNEKIITVYRRNKPSESEVSCEIKTCEWCGQSIYASNFTIKEYPDVRFLKGEGNYISLLDNFFTILFNSKKYYDMENNRIRTEWEVNCEYPGPEGYCSRKCSYESKNNY